MRVGVMGRFEGKKREKKEAVGFRYYEPSVATDNERTSGFAAREWRGLSPQEL